MRKLYIQKVSKDLLNKYGFEPPVPLEELVEKCGLTIRKVNAGDSDIDAKFSNEKLSITINLGQTNLFRRRFSIAHELGHFVLKHSHNPWEFEDPDTGESTIEKEADEFAGSLLMPRDFLFQKLNEGLSPQEIQKLCQVSNQALWVRIQLYNLTKFIKS